MDVIEAIHGRRSVRSYDRRPIERDLIESVILDAAQAPPPFRDQVPWTFNVVEGVDRIAAYGARAMDYARNHHPDEPGWDWVERPGFKIFWDAPVLIIISGPVGDCCRAGQNLMLSARTRIGNVLGRLADALAEHAGGKGGVGDIFSPDAGCGAVPRLCRCGF
jgi:nitroreductase